MVPHPTHPRRARRARRAAWITAMTITSFAFGIALASAALEAAGADQHVATLKLTALVMVVLSVPFMLWGSDIFNALRIKVQNQGIEIDRLSRELADRRIAQAANVGDFDHPKSINNVRG